MISVIVFPERVKKAIAGSESKKRKSVLGQIEDRIRLSFNVNSNNVYNDISNYTFFENFKNSFILMANDGKEASYFVDEEMLNSDTDVVNEFLSVSGFLVQRRTRVLQTTLDALSEGAKRFKKRGWECESLPLSEMEDGLWENLPQYFSEARINRHEGDTDAFLYPKTFYHQEIRV